MTQNHGAGFISGLIAKAIFAIAIIGVPAGLYISNRQSAALSKQALENGFVDSAEMKAAAEVDIHDGATWRDHVAKQKARDDREKAQRLRAITFIVRVKRSMKNPASFAMDQALLMNDRSICLAYRATNSFNAVVPGQAVLTPEDKVATNEQGPFAGLWGKYCGGKRGENLHILSMEVNSIDSLMR